jgi:phage shock protein E
MTPHDFAGRGYRLGRLDEEVDSMKGSFLTRSLCGLLTILGIGCAAMPGLAAEHTKDSSETVKKAVADKKAVLLDVREKAEWDEGHLRDAKLLPLSDLRKGVKVEDLMRVLPKDKVIYCHCASGRRCLAAADILKKNGYDVRPLKSGFMALLKEGFAPASK